MITITHPITIVFAKKKVEKKTKIKKKKKMFVWIRSERDWLVSESND